MLNAYINYPNPHITIHAKAGCPAIHKMHKKEQRVARLDVDSLSSELNRFAVKKYRFAAQTETNDLWLEVNFGDSTFERAVVEYVRTLLAQHYTPFTRIKIGEHC